MGTNRQVQSSRPSRAYLVEGPVRPCVSQVSPTLLPPIPGNHSSSTFRFVSHHFSTFSPDKLTFKPFTQPDSVYTIEDALARISQSCSLSMQVVQSSSNEATQRVLLEALPQILVLRLVTTESINTIRKRVQFGPELEIPLGAGFLVYSSVSEG